MSAALAIARKEWRVLFVSPLAWTLLAAAAALCAYWLLLGAQLFEQSSAELAKLARVPGVTDVVVVPYLASCAGMLVFLAPLLTMRCVCEERRAGTLALLYAGGASDAAIVWGKFLGVMGFFVVFFLIVFAMPLGLSLGTHLDWGKCAASATSLMLLAAALTALGVFASSVAHHPATAALGALGAGTLLWMIDLAARAQGETQGLINYLAIPTHLSPFLRGIVASVDVAYFVLLAVAGLSLATWRVARLREDG
jgi:ABC-2 type transport system permease protein